MTLTYPLDTIRARLAFQVTGEHKYSGIVHTGITILKNVTFEPVFFFLFFFFQFGLGIHFIFFFHRFIQQEGGVIGLYRGFVPTLTGMVPYAGFSFYCFESVKFLCMNYVPQWTCNKCDKNTGK